MKRLQKISSLTWVFFVMVLLIKGQDQSNYLGQRMSVSVHEITLEETLDIIAKNGNFLFSYNADLFNADQLVSVDAENRSVERILKQLLGPSIKPMVVGHHVVLLNKKAENEETYLEASGYLVTGYIRNRETGQKIPEATIFDVSSNACYSTNAEGRYEIKCTKSAEKPILNYCKAGYLDTMIMVNADENQRLDIYLEPNSLEDLERKEMSALDLKPQHENRLINAMVPKEVQTTSENLSIYDPGSVQVSLLPFIGTNRFIKGAQVHRLSINILAGYSSGINGVEVGGLFNMIRYDVNGVQVAGIGNLVGGDVKGTQVAGIFNANAGKMEGIQVAGFSNTINDRLTGMQISGFSNFTTEQVDGLQISGFSNVSLKDVTMMQVGGFVNYGRNIIGSQTAGFANIASEKVHSAQIAGALNLAKNVKGLQLAGVMNIARDSMGAAQVSGFMNNARTLKGFQLAGFANVVSEQTHGVQLSGFMNYSKEVTGAQLSTFNFADRFQKGVPIGFFSYVKHGYHPVEAGSNELFTAYISYKTGVKKLYNIFSAAYHPDRFSAGYGFGSIFHFGKRFGVNLDLTGNMIFTTHDQVNFNGVVNKFVPSLNFRMLKKLTLTAGPSLNFYQPVRQAGDTDGIYPNPFYERSTTFGMQQWWIGWNAGIRF